MKSDKRLPTLADRFVAQRYAPRQHCLKLGLVEDMQRKTRLARKFVLDDRAALRVGNVVRDIPDLIVREHQFARPPFDLCWIEYPSHVYWRACGNPIEYQTPDACHTIGYLIDHGMVTVISGGTIENPGKTPGPTVLQYRLNTAWDARDIKFFKDEGEEAGTQFDEFLWGSSYYRMDPALRSRLRELNSIAPFSFASHVSFELAELLLSQALLEGGGELRTILALLLMLNRPTVTRYEEVAAGRGWIRNKHVPYMAHTAITIDLDAVPTMRLIGTEAGEGVPRRRHEVRGHFCHDHTARDYLRIAGCIHDWQVTALDEKIPDFPIRWECAACGGKRWWKHQHERGDASRGWVSHDYNVTS